MNTRWAKPRKAAGNGKNNHKSKKVKGDHYHEVERSWTVCTWYIIRTGGDQAAVLKGCKEGICSLHGRDFESKGFRA